MCIRLREIRRRYKGNGFVLNHIELGLNPLYIMKTERSQKMTKGVNLMGCYRIENIRLIRLNGELVKIFTAYEYNPKLNGYVHVGQYVAPKNTKNKDLINYIE
jgi:hypothetical protein